MGAEPVEWFGRLNITKMALMSTLSLAGHFLDTMVIIVESSVFGCRLISLLTRKHGPKLPNSIRSGNSNAGGRGVQICMGHKYLFSNRLKSAWVNVFA